MQRKAGPHVMYARGAIFPNLHFERLLGLQCGE